MIRIEEVEHTADIRLRLCVEEIQEFYLGVVEAMRYLTGVEALSKAETVISLKLEGRLEDQIFDLGNELIFQLSRGFFPIALSKIGSELKVELGRVVQHPTVELKALTYHELKVTAFPNGFCTYLIFDV
ncbi:MAG: archease [Thermotogae bacterium]|nr:archease [Thermotogota bacterium]